MKFLFASLLFFVSVSVFAQADYASVDSKVATYPKFTSADDLSARIKKDFTADKDRVRAIFTYAATNITYDLNEAKNGSRIAYEFSSAADRQKKEFEFRNGLVSQALKTRKAVCEGYASVFVEVCRQLDIKAVIVPGSSRTHVSQIGKLPTWKDHVWNAVELDGKWHLLDITWAAGNVDTNTGKFKMEFNDGYFLPPPVDFFKNHFPDNPEWMLINGSAELFAGQAFYYPTYFKEKYRISLQHGMLKINKPTRIEIQIDGLKPGAKMYHTFGSQNTLKPLSVTDGKVEVLLDGKRAGNLTLFVETKPIVAYKITRS